MLFDVARDLYLPASTGSILSVEAKLGAQPIAGALGYCIEKPWMNGANLHGQSAILEGLFEASIFLSPHLNYEVLLLHNVPGRDMIEFHIANTPAELLGCIAPGLTRSENYVDSSKLVHDAVMALARIARKRGEKIYFRVRRAA